MSSAVKESNSQALVGETGHLTGQASQTAGHTANKLDHPNVFANSWLSHLFDRNGRPHPLTAHLFGLNHSDVNSHPVGSHQRPASVGRHSPNTAHQHALANIKLSHFLEGIHVTANFGWAALFSFFILWLFVVYWVRHHEPFANQVLGSVPQTSSVYADRRLVNGIKTAFPIRISPDTGTVYEPLPGGQNSTTSFAAGAPSSVQAASVSSTQLFGSPVQGQDQTTEVSTFPGNSAIAASNYATTAVVQPQMMVAPTVPTTSAAAYSINSHGSYAVSAVPSRNGTKLKFIVNE